MENKFVAIDLGDHTAKFVRVPDIVLVAGSNKVSGCEGEATGEIGGEAEGNGVCDKFDAIINFAVFLYNCQG